MNKQLVNMLEDLKIKEYTSYTNYLDSATEKQLVEWFSHFSSKKSRQIESAIDLLYELYFFEDIDFRPCEEYTKRISYLAEKYSFDKMAFLDLYQQFRQLVFERR